MNTKIEESARRRAGLLLIVLVASFATLVPGGPIETRDFSNLNDPIFWGFNFFLIGLGVVALVSGIALMKNSRFFIWPAIAAAWGYIFVVMLDLGAVFPASPDSIPLALGLIEIFDLILACYILLLCHRALNHI